MSFATDVKLVYFKHLLWLLIVCKLSLVGILPAFRRLAHVPSSSRFSIPWYFHQLVIVHSWNMWIPLWSNPLCVLRNTLLLNSDFVFWSCWTQFQSNFNFLNFFFYSHTSAVKWGAVFDHVGEDRSCYSFTYNYLVINIFFHFRVFKHPTIHSDFIITMNTNIYSWITEPNDLCRL